jgi:ferredoxin-NADP reductase
MRVETPYTIYYDTDADCVVMHWDGYATSFQFREGTEYMLSMLKQHNARKVLADIKDMTIIGREDQNYVQFNFLPRAIAEGFRAIALVKPVSYFNAVAIETISYRVKQTVVQMRVFDDLDSAKEWLRNLDPDTL